MTVEQVAEMEQRGSSAATGRADLHVHSTASDGSFTPREVVEEAKRRGLRAIGLTDHDTVDGLLEARRAGSDGGLEVIPGVELSSSGPGGEGDVHILGYWIDTASERLLEALETSRAARHQRAEEIVARLRALGQKIDLESVYELAGGGSVGRPHIARALAARGYVGDVQEAFDRFLGRGKPAWVPRDQLSAREAISLVRDAGGVAVLAHPGLLRRQSWIRPLIEAGLQGIEARHTQHTPRQVRRYEALAADAHLLVTGGSDCHGPRGKSGTLMGSVTVPYARVAALNGAARGGRG